MKIKNVVVVEGPYSISAVMVGEYRIGWFGYSGNKKAWGCHVQIFGKTWYGPASTPTEATEMIVEVAQAFLEDVLDD